MHKLSVRVTIALVLLAVAAAVSALTLYPAKHQRGSELAADLPLMVDQWVGREVAVEDYVKQILETDDVIQRNYVNPLDGFGIIQLAVVFSPDNRRVAHPPEVCYKAAGWEVNNKSIVEVMGLPPMVRLIMAYGGQRDMVLYCYKAGPEMTANYYRQQFNIALNQLLMRSTSSALIRISASIEVDETTTQARLSGFARQLLPEIIRVLD